MSYKPFSVENISKDDCPIDSGQGEHTQLTAKSLEEKIQNGMFMEIQEKAMTKDNLDYLMANNLYEHFALVTDDVMAVELELSVQVS